MKFSKVRGSLTRFWSLRGLMMVAIAWLTGEIFIRRWFWHQVPTQVSPAIVNGLLLFNAMWVIRFLSGWVWPSSSLEGRGK